MSADTGSIDGIEDAAEADDDLPTLLTRMLRNVPGVHTVYATKPLVPTLVSAVVEFVKNEPVGVHLVRVSDGEAGVEIEACIGVTRDEPAPEVCRRAYAALNTFFVEHGQPEPAAITVRIGRVV
jgi:hypothetical protein